MSAGHETVEVTPGIYGLGSAPIAHAGHPAEWLPFVAPLLLLALAWLVIRAVQAGSAEQEEEVEGKDPRPLDKP